MLKRYEVFESFEHLVLFIFPRVVTNLRKLSSEIFISLFQITLCVNCKKKIARYIGAICNCRNLFQSFNVLKVLFIKEGIVREGNVRVGIVRGEMSG